MESLVLTHIFGEVDESGNNFFHDVCLEGCSRLLLRFGSWLDETNENLLQTVNFNGYQCVHIVARNHRGPKAVQLMKLLVELGADINAPDRLSGSTALHFAVLYQDYHLVDWICRETLVDLEAQDYGKMMAFQVAWKRGDTKMLDLLWEHGVDGDQPLDTDSEDSDCDDQC